MKTNFMQCSLSFLFSVFKGPYKERKHKCPDVFVYTMRISWVKPNAQDGSPQGTFLSVSSGELCTILPSGLLLLGLWEEELPINHHDDHRKKEFGLLPGSVVNFQIKEMF